MNKLAGIKFKQDLTFPECKIFMGYFYEIFYCFSFNSTWLF